MQRVLARHDLVPSIQIDFGAQTDIVTTMTDHESDVVGVTSIQACSGGNSQTKAVQQRLTTKDQTEQPTSSMIHSDHVNSDSQAHPSTTKVQIARSSSVMMGPTSKHLREKRRLIPVLGKRVHRESDLQRTPEP